MSESTDTSAEQRQAVAAILGDDGMLAKLLDNYESRPQQLDMATVVSQAITERKHAVVEAPTGVGKSFAYLVPAIQFALQHNKKVVISTGTIALQEQLIHKDLPIMQECFPLLKSVLVKGRQNYLSLRRLEHAMQGEKTWFESRDDLKDLNDILTWSQETQVGDKADLGYDPNPSVWRKVVSDNKNCLGRRCPRYADCFFYQARRDIEDADILVVNHHLYFSDLALRSEHAAILPPHDVVIFDEAHSLEDVATDHLGVQLNETQIRYYLDGLYNQRRKTGLVAEGAFDQARDAVERCRLSNTRLWQDVALSFGDRQEDTMTLPVANNYSLELADELEALGGVLQEFRNRSDDDNTAQEFKAQADRALDYAGQLRQVIEQQFDHYVYYATVPSGRGSASLSANPLKVGELLSNLLFSSSHSVILTSATLAADDSERFLFLRKRLGLEEALTRRLDSPFDFKKQARLLVNESPLDPNGPEFERALAMWLGEFLEQESGGTFILFTSYRQLERVHELVAPRLERANRFVLRHGGGMGRSQMIELFKSTGNAVLFGTASFWEGVDVRGDALKNVIITKIPFEVPNHPLVEARHNDIKANGGNAFMERTVPEAILRLKQGVGRLIRTRQDQGTIVLCDHRIRTKSYGRYFLRALDQFEPEFFKLSDYS